MIRPRLTSYLHAWGSDLHHEGNAGGRVSLGTQTRKGLCAPDKMTSPTYSIYNTGKVSGINEASLLLTERLTSIMQ